MHEEIIIKILDRASTFVLFEHIKRLRNILDEELYHYALVPTSQELVPVNDMSSKIQLFLACKNLDGLSPKTLRNYGRELMKFSFVIQKNMDQINDMDIRVYLSAKSRSGNKNSTLNTLRSALCSFFGWMVEMGYITKNPVQIIKPIKTEKKIRHPLTHEELEMLRDTCNTARERAMVEFFYSTGCRLDEIQKLSLSKINWSDRSMTVIGKGSKEREVYINKKAMFYLKKYLKTRTDNDDAVFVRDRRPHSRLCARMIEQTFSNLGKRAGITKPVFPHLLRHTFATHLRDAGADLQHIQNLLGHTNASTTQVYIEVNQKAVKQCYETNMAG